MPVFPVFPIDVVGAAQAVPTSLTAITATDSQLFTLYISNPTAGALTFTLTDGQSSPVSLFSTVSLAADGVFSLDLRQGIQLTGGVKWQASGSGLVGAYMIKRKSA